MLTYQRAEELWAKKAKNKDFRRVETDLRLRKLDDGSYTIAHVGWHADPSSPRGWSKGEIPLATLSTDSVLTIELDERPCVTLCNRFTSMIGRTLYLDARHFKNYEHTARINMADFNSYAPKDSIPFVKGLQFLLIEGEKSKCLNPVADVKTVVKPEASKQLKTELDTLRKLTAGMTRMGAFDSIIHTKLRDRWSMKAPSPETINFLDPSADDAERVFRIGLVHSQIESYVYRDGRYHQLDDDAKVALLRQRGLKNGLDKLRKHIYEQRDGYTKVSTTPN